MRPYVLDFETQAIQGRPNYPPDPVGVAIMDPRGRSHYYAWGHPSENNCTREEGIAALQRVWSSGRGVVFHNARFDLAVAEEKLGLPMLAEERIHDTMLLAFLDNPHTPSLGLKPLAEHHFNLPPEERDAVRDWLVEHQVCTRTSAQWGAFIAYAPGKLVGDYAIGDVERTYKLYAKLMPSIEERGMSDAYDRERFLTPLLHENEKHGVRVDHARLAADVERYAASLSLAEEWLRVRLKAPELNLDADQQLVTALRNASVVTEFARTSKGKDSVAKNTLTKDRFSDEQVFQVLGYRNRLKTCLSTFMCPWLDTANQSGGRVFTGWRQVGARTGRFSSSPNFQNMPSSWYGKPDGYKHPEFLGVPELPILRSYILPDEDEVLVSADFSSQEVRVAAHFEDGSLMEAYNNPNPPKEWCNKDGEFDPHSFVARTIKELAGVEYDRTTTKIGLFTTLYGGGAAKLAEQLGNVSTAQATAIKKAIFTALPGMKTLDEELKARARANESFKTLGGRAYKCEPSKLVDGRVLNFDYKMLNILIQGSSADQTKAAMLRYAYCKDRKGRLLLTVHDELVVSVPEKYAIDEAKILAESMTHALPLDVPMGVKTKIGRTFAETK